MLPLLDNHPDDKFQYEVYVYTSMTSRAGTDSNVYLVVAGTDDDTGTRALRDGHRKVRSLLLKSSEMSPKHMFNRTFNLVT